MLGNLQALNRATPELFFGETIKVYWKRNSYFITASFPVHSDVGFDENGVYQFSGIAFYDGDFNGSMIIGGINQPSDSNTKVLVHEIFHFHFDAYCKSHSDGPGGGLDFSSRDFHGHCKEYSSSGRCVASYFDEMWNEARTKRLSRVDLVGIDFCRSCREIIQKAY
jgi:hypothetical protein